MITMAATIFTTAQVAEKFETTPRQLRKFLRSEQGMNATVGKGKRWGIEGKQLAPLKKRFIAWNAALEAKKTDEVADAPEAPETDS
jgi:hypothetical protein